MKQIKLQVGSKQDIGRVRDENQDALAFVNPDDERILSKKGHLFIVADGMGGHIGGRIASRIAVEAIENEYYSNPSESPVISLTAALNKANSLILDKSIQDSSLEGMGTTCTTLVCKDDLVYFAHIGDSRAYQIQNGKIKKLTSDHSYVQKMIDEGLLKEEEARSHPQSSVIIRSLGTKQNIEIDVSDPPISIEPGDIFIICSDGLWDVVNDEEIEDVAYHEKDPQCACDRLVSLANERGGPDNISILILRCMVEEETSVEQEVTAKFPPPPFREDKEIEKNMEVKEGKEEEIIEKTENGEDDEDEDDLLIEEDDSPIEEKAKEEVISESTPSIYSISSEKREKRLTRWKLTIGLTLIFLIGGGYAAYYMMIQRPQMAIVAAVEEARDGMMAEKSAIKGSEWIRFAEDSWKKAEKTANIADSEKQEGSYERAIEFYDLAKRQYQHAGKVMVEWTALRNEAVSLQGNVEILLQHIPQYKNLDEPEINSRYLQSVDTFKKAETILRSEDFKGAIILLSRIQNQYQDIQRGLEFQREKNREKAESLQQRVSERAITLDGDVRHYVSKLLPVAEEKSIAASTEMKEERYLDATTLFQQLLVLYDEAEEKIKKGKAAEKGAESARLAEQSARDARAHDFAPASFHKAMEALQEGKTLFDKSDYSDAQVKFKMSQKLFHESSKESKTVIQLAERERQAEEILAKEKAEKRQAEEILAKEKAEKRQAEEILAKEKAEKRQAEEILAKEKAEKKLNEQQKRAEALQAGLQEILRSDQAEGISKYAATYNEMIKQFVDAGDRALSVGEYEEAIEQFEKAERAFLEAKQTAGKVIQEEKENRMREAALKWIQDYKLAWGNGDIKGLQGLGLCPDEKSKSSLEDYFKKKEDLNVNTENVEILDVSGEEVEIRFARVVEYTDLYSQNKHTEKAMVKKLLTCSDDNCILKR
ncbi:Stp1/IreP family PP2C-type Ser/Thr phosphatase [Thermodesulfobacteriota bacterium]